MCIRDSSNAFSIGNWDSERISFELPYINGDKTTILKDAVISCDILNLNFNEIMGSTITSYNPDKNGKSSGKSGSDVERILAFHEIGLVDPIQYSSSWDSVLENALKLKHKVGE